MTETLSVIVRSSSVSRLAFLEQALFSLATQHYEDIEVLLMLQSPSDEFAARATALANAQPWPPQSNYKVIKVGVEQGIDGRARLLNEGIAVSRGRYLAFLDDDDVVYAGGYSTLIDTLRRSSAAIAVGDCRIAYVTEQSGVIHVSKKVDGFFRGVNQSKFDLFSENFIPIHSYVIDMTRTSSPPSFRDAAIPLEDYDFLLRFANGHEFNLESCTVPVCEYRMHENNTLWSNASTKDTSPILQKARAFIQDVKRTLTMTISESEYTMRKSFGAALHGGSQTTLQLPFLVRKAAVVDQYIRRRPVLLRISVFFLSVIRAISSWSRNGG